MEITAKLRYYRQSPRKVRLVTDLICGKDVNEALNQLQFAAKRAAPIQKLLSSAIANAVNNFSLKKENLYVEKISVDCGPVLKRWMPRAFGRASEIRKRTSHVTVVLNEKIKTAARKTEDKKEAKTPQIGVPSRGIKMAQETKIVKSDERKAAKGGRKIGSGRTFAPKLFQRKSG